MYCRHLYIRTHQSLLHTVEKAILGFFVSTITGKVAIYAECYTSGRTKTRPRRLYGERYSVMLCNVTIIALSLHSVWHKGDI